jgi:hypothetical protein
MEESMNHHFEGSLGNQLGFEDQPSAPGEKADLLPAPPGVLFSRRNNRLNRLMPAFLWQEQRMKVAARLCRAIEKRRGIPVMEKARRLANYWRGRNYRGTEQPAKLSRSTIVRLYYLWISSGRNDGIFALKQNYVATLREVMRLARVSLTPGVDTYKKALAIIPDLKCHESTLRQALPRRLHLEIDRLFRTRRALQRSEIRVRREIAKLEASK